MNQSILKIEKYLILYPTTFILVPGLIYMILMPLGDVASVFSNGSTQKQISFLVFEALTLLSAGALYSIWLATEKCLERESTFSYSKHPYIYAGIVVGILISLLSLIELAIPNHYIKQILEVPEKTAFFIMYIFGLPICLPAIHILLMSKYNHANKAINSDRKKRVALS